MKRTAPASVEAYFAALPEEQRRVLDRVRATLRAAMPGATEVISYGIPTFKRDGHVVVAYAAFRDHYSLFGLTNDLFDEHPEWRPYSSGRGTLRFTEERPLPATVVRKVVRLRLARNKALDRERAARRAAKKPSGAKGVTKPVVSRRRGAPPRRPTRA